MGTITKQMTWYFIRLTTDNTTKNKIAEKIGEPFLISVEKSQRNVEHYHIVHKSSLSKEQLKIPMYEIDPTRPKGPTTLQIDIIGNTLEDWEKVSTYTVKDGDFIHCKYFDNYIEKFISNSFTKQKPYKQAIKILIEDVTEQEYNRINWQQVKRDIMILRSQYIGMDTYTSKIEAMVLTIQVRMNQNVAYEKFPDE